MSLAMLISEAFRIYRSDYIVMLNQSPKTEEAYSCTGKLLERYFGNIDITSIDFENVRKWHEYLSSYQRPDTVRNNIVNLRNVLKFLRRKQLPVLDYELIPVQRREKRLLKYLNEEEFDRFVAEAGRSRRGYLQANKLRNIALIETLYATGLRNNELCALNRTSIRERQFTVIGKSKDPRIGFTNQRAMDAIYTYLDSRTDSNPALFIAAKSGNRITTHNVREIFQNLCNASEEFSLVTPRTIRHSYATKLLRHKVDIRHIGDLMGHQSLDTTKIYTHYENPELKDIYDNANGLLTK